MFGQVQVHNLQMLGVIPGIGSMLGTNHSPAVLERLQAQSGGQVIFGQEGDPIADRYRAMCDLIHKHFDIANQAMERVRETIVNPNVFRPIECEEDLYNVAPCMQEAIITYEPIRQLIEDGRIYGYGVKPENLPEEDVYGRLINNGKVKTDSKELEWMWKTDDPQLTETDLEAIEQTRGWIDAYLTMQMQPDGDYKDPTDPSNTISKKRK